MKKIAEFARELVHLHEVELKGTAVSRGIAVGRAIRLYGTKRQFTRISIPSEAVGSELARLRGALEIAMGELQALAGESSSLPSATRSIFDVHYLILAHSSFVSDIEEAIEVEHVNAEWAIARVTAALTDKLRQAPDVHVREKAVDVQDVAERLLNALSPDSRPPASFWADAVIVAPSIRPSTMVELARFPPKAIVTEHGGWTSHAFIMARELRIPAVTSLQGLCRNVGEGDAVLVDGFAGRVIIRPEEDTVELAMASRNDLSRHSATTEVSGPAFTADGREIVIRANAEHFGSAAELSCVGADGVGLLRSEYLFDMKRGAFPAEEVQFSEYQKIAEKLAGTKARIRTFDLNAEQISVNSIDRDKNPALGLRAIRLMLSNESSFRSQVRAILRANSRGNISILLPMVSGPEDIVRARRLIDDECRALSISQDGRPQIGVMIEVPSAVMLIDEIVRIVDFVCLGTNDLVQYLLAVDRDNESVADWYQTLHPAVLRSINTVLRTAENVDIPAVVCGEMAGSPFYIPLLIGMGAKEFSMNVNAVPYVRRIIREITYDEGREIAMRALASTDAHDTEGRLRSFYWEKWPHLFEPYEMDMFGNMQNGAKEK